MKRCYISGAISNEPYYKTYFGIAAYCVKCMRLEPVSPLTVNPLFGIDKWLCYMIPDILLLLTCSHVYFMRNWTESRGARIEHAISVLAGKKIIYEVKPIKK